MDEAGNIVSRIAMLAVYIFGAMSVLAICYAGFMYMTAAGDPQKSGQARNALFGAIGGMIIVGVAFMVPRLISETVIEPSGGAAVGGSTTVSCDEIFRNQLVRQQAASTAQRMNQVKVQVQQRQSEDCSSEVWNPIVIADPDAAYKAGVDGGWVGVTATNPANHGLTTAAPVPGTGTAAGATDDSDSHEDCAAGGGDPTVPQPARTIAGLGVPRGLFAMTSVDARTGRDGQNNVIVYFTADPNNRPSDGGACWMYVERLGNWVTALK